ncbi:MAG: TonB-dependent receptor [Tannerellaceae bacterium]|jgi:TonB-linked SusC/RagA family outer membrane protein|nr:TonB-dependent receptor [Tannerellaceae bacterium]
MFSYKDVTLDNRKDITLTVSNERVESVLDKVLSSKGLSYIKTGNTFAIKPKVVVLATINKPEKRITGKVTDDQSEPIIGANVVEKGTTNGTITDMDGKFSLNVADNAVLQITFIGYVSQEIGVSTESGNVPLTIRLLENTQVMEEIVVVGYGTQRKADLTGAVANVSTSNLNVESNSSIMNLLQGKMAGIQIVSSGGEPGAGSRIMIRGIGTFNNADPLYVVDGMYMDNIDHLNPRDIERIDVLKDASSAAIYGSRAANGVVLVTTKSGGNTNGVVQIDVSANLGIITPMKYVGILNADQWADVSTRARQAAGLIPYEMAVDIQGRTDWQDEILNPALMQNYNTTLKGGRDNYTYYTTLGYLNQEGTYLDTYYERFNAQYKSQYKNNRFTFGNNIFLAMENRKFPNNANGRGGSAVALALLSIPTLPIYNPSNKGGYAGPIGDVANLANPVGAQKLQKRLGDNYMANVNLYAMLDLPFSLQYKLNVNGNFRLSHSLMNRPTFDMGQASEPQSVHSESNSIYRSYLVENLLTLDRTFGLHKVNALAGYTFQYNSTRGLGGDGRNIPEGIYVLGAVTTDKNVSGSLYENTMTSVIARAFYSYDNRYLLTLSFRRDGSSRFSSTTRYGNFPSVSAGWNVAEEKFWTRPAWLDQLKIRAGYGVLGNQEVGDYRFLSTITGNVNYVSNNSLWTGSFPKNFASPDIRWESTAMTNVGMDLALLGGRLSSSIEYYNKMTKDILLEVPIPISTGGANSPLVNAGHIQNKGFEITLGWQERTKNNFTYSFNLTAATVSNEVTRMGVTGDEVLWGGYASFHGTNTTKSLVGYPIGGFWLVKTDGLFQTEEEVNAYRTAGGLIQPNAKPGDIRFIDANGDGAINENDRVYCGSPFPDANFGLNMDFGYKGIDLVIGFDAVVGNKIYNALRTDLENVSNGTNYSANMLDAWTDSNRNTDVPRLISGDPNNNLRLYSDRFLEDGSFFRMRNFQLGYTFPTRLSNKLSAKKLRVFFSADNVFMITKYTGYNPDINMGNVLSRGVDNFAYPANNIYMFGLNLNF